MDISVILTLYKRPHNLKKQFEAIKNQTIKPAEILLFQDGTNDETKIEIPLDIKDKFDNIKISPKNVGVWGRFDFAKSAKSELVCVFDDDTIPGEKWLENCLNEFKKKEGLYGTNGILMEKPQNYPFCDYQRIGWFSSNKNSIEVDFVGHSWFLKRQWLEYMFENTQTMQDFRVCAEDMTLSAKLLEHGIHTFIPPHPYNNLKLWGSIPDETKNICADENALSVNKENLEKYNKAMNLLLNNGFKPLIIREKNKTQHLINKMMLIKRLTWIIRLNGLREKLRKILFYLFNI